MQDSTIQVVDAVLRASRVLVSVAARSLAAVDHDVTLPQYRALVVLASRGPQRPTALAEALAVHPSTITRLCDRLVRKRLVHRAASPTNRREVSIRLTPKGRRLVDTVTERRRTEIATIVARIPARERATMVHALHALGEAAGEPADAAWFSGADAVSPGDTTSRFREFARRSHEVIVLAAITGVVTGFAVALFDRIVVDGILDHLFELSPWLLAFMPLVGLGLSWLALCVRGPLARLRHDRPLPQGVPRSRPAVALPRGSRPGAGVDRHAWASAAPWASRARRCTSGRSSARSCSGASRASPSGAAAGSCMVAGAAAGVAAIFKAPATGAIFALEVPYQEDLARRMLLPALVASASGYLAFVAVNDITPLFEVHGAPPLSFADLAGALVLGVAAGICARGFAWLRARRQGAHHPVRRVDPHRRRRPHPRGAVRAHLAAHRPAGRHRGRLPHHRVGPEPAPRALVAPGRAGRALPGHRRHRRGQRRGRPVHPAGRRRRAPRAHRRRPRRERQPHAVRGDRRGRIPGCGLPGAAGGGDVRGRDHRPARVHRARPARRGRRRAGDGPRLGHHVPTGIHRAAPRRKRPPRE